MAGRAHIVCDLGFGDAGKGLVTDFLVRETGARLVVRYNGGAQAGHNVVTPDGRHHTFAQFGAGSFVPGVRTFLSQHVVVHPPALFVEARALARVGVGDALDRLRVSAGALVITPFHQAAGRLRELARGAGRHGSCGVGLGETVGDALARPAEAVRAGDLARPEALRARLRAVRDRKRAEVEAWPGLARDPAAQAELAALHDDAVVDRFLETACPLARHLALDDLLGEWLAEPGDVVFEGAQGVLLDETLGFHPHTTWSRCTPANALELLARWAPERAVERIGILRSHAVRHGPGPLPSETDELAGKVVEHNRTGPWQGPVRYGWFDAVLARYALAAAGPVERLAITHLDLLDRLENWQVWTGHGTLECPANPTTVLSTIEALLGHRVDLTSTGPSAVEVRNR